MNRDLISYIEFIELMNREESKEFNFEKKLDYLSENILYVTHNQLNDIYRQLYAAILGYNVISEVGETKNIKRYDIGYDFDEDDDDVLFTINVTLDHKIERTIHIGATIKQETIGDMDAFVEQYDNILTNKITLVDFIKFTNRKSYVFHKAFQDILIKNMEKIVDYFNRNYEQKFVYRVVLDQKDKYIMFYKVENNKVINSYYFQWKLEK